ncbi:hypothetical protein, partial [Bartonella henselae]|uniref:hypothetical protein n=2 Tax=Bartonella henselae TaxID=38323 RepID=UPI00249DA908
IISIAFLKINKYILYKIAVNITIIEGEMKKKIKTSQFKQENTLFTKYLCETIITIAQISYTLYASLCCKKERNNAI